ncbi:P24 [Agrotis segetum nucleopolyhedrovirus A]|uniref:p24 n=1 Tax=Agrotis segetum nuclear polyhedrosis virus TaxID=1962501 RepID=Q287R1_NPVAS|nr:P24 [Agrotis segetum nucleopolyhedrovirus A]AAZ38177.1 P24 [Agrotis segetum nucleopolyhedrovirus A]
MYDNTTGSNAQSAPTDSALQFQYQDKLLEVVIIENDDGDRDGYVELSAIAQLIAPIVNIRGFNAAVMWANVHTSQRLMRNNKNYVHAFALGRYLSSYKLSSADRHRAELLVLKQLMGDLLIGAQSQVVDPLIDIKTQLCSLQECLSGNNNIAANDTTIYHSPQPFDTAPGNNYTETLRDILRSEHVSLLANISGALETIKSMQADLTNKIAFSNDTMLDGFKSIKDIINRKK